VYIVTTFYLCMIFTALWHQNNDNDNCSSIILKGYIVYEIPNNK